MKTYVNSHCVLTALTTAIGAILLAASPHVARAQTNFVSGPSAGVSFTTGVYNTAYGINALRFDTTGSYNTAVGPNSLLNNVGGNQNTAIGVNVLQSNGGGSFNTGLGVNALSANTSGTYNTAIGNSALLANLAGQQNTATGLNAMFKNTGGSFNSAFGLNALASNLNGNNNTAIGYKALLSATGTGNIAVGLNAGQNLTNGSNDIYIGNVGGVATESGIIRIGTTGTHTDTYLTGNIHGNGSALTAINGASLTAGSITSVQLAASAVQAGNIANGAVGSTKLAAGAAAANLQAGNQTAVPSGGVLLSATDNNTNLTNAGYVKIGTASTSPETWSAGTTTNAPAKRTLHTAVWTGAEMIVWGGSTETFGAPLGDGGRYNPAGNTWTAIPAGMLNEPAARLSHTAVWTGTEMIVWGGWDNSSYFGDGGRYDPAGAGTWTAIASGMANEPAGRRLHTMVWTGTEMIVWGGFGGSTLDNGGRYTPGTNSWTAIASGMANEPSPRYLHTAVWTGSQMIVWGGVGAAAFDNGGLYTPGTNSWTAIAGGMANEPSKRSELIAVWTGTEMIVWGGTYFDGSVVNYYNDGGRYTPGTNSWAAVPNSLTNTPSARIHHTVVWAGTEMIIFGGDAGANPLSDGGRYNPAGNSWTTLTHSGEPPARTYHTAVWTGSEMIVFGGDAGSALKLNDTFLYSTGRVMYLYQRP